MYCFPDLFEHTCPLTDSSVGRYNEYCSRYRDASFPEYDEEKLLKYKGGITSALEKIIKDKARAC